MKSDPQIPQMDSDKDIRVKEAVYQEALELEFQHLNIPYEKLVYNLRESVSFADNMTGVDL
ncbi:MAG: hypothetical protein U9N47_02280 [Thermodesulfobacteriota bacterium]|nr:hypothetical protein [Thermodesulfobacteriota bacterium]